MTTMTQSSSDTYYDLIDSKGCKVIVFGELEEQWTDEVLDIFEREEIDTFFFPWSKCLDLRLQLEIIYYPYIQLWVNGRLQMELIGYHNESIKNLITEMK